MTRILRIHWAVMMIILCTGALRAQDEVLFNPQAEGMFLLGVRQFVQLDFQSAYQTLRHTSEIMPVNQRTTASIIMAAKAANALHQYGDAAELSRMLLTQYPFSSYVEDAHYTLGLADEGLERLPDAASEMMTVIATAQTGATRWRAEECLERLAVTFTPDVIGALDAQAQDDSTRVLLMLLRGEAYAGRGMKDSAAAAANAVIARSGDQKLLKRARRLIMPERTNDAGDTVTIGVLLPFMHNYKTETSEGMTAKEIMQGIREALHDYASDASGNHRPVRLDVQDSQREKGRIARTIEQWRSDTSLVAIIGPLFSDETIAAATAANAAGIPLVTPTATGNNIASIGTYIFQASPDYTMRGVLMAQYAVRTAGMNNLAIIASDAFPASLLGDAFAAEVNRLGAHLVSYQHYSSGTSDFRPLFRMIKTDVSRAHTGGLQAVYCPIANSGEIGVLAAQIRMLDPSVMVLGSDEWNDDEQLDRSRSAADGVIFPSDKWSSDPSQPISGFSIESFGYDAATLVFDCLDRRAETRRSMQAALAHVSEFDGIHSKISFEPTRVNTHLHVLQYKKGFIKKIDDIEYRQ